VNLAPEAACTFLLSVLNGFLVDLLFMRTAQLDLPDALDLLRAILFRPDGNEMPRAADAGSAGVIKENP